jgi:hypothetical protein
MKYIKAYEDEHVKEQAIDDDEYVVAIPKRNLPNQNWINFMKHNTGQIKSHYYVDNHLIYIIDFKCDIGDGHQRMSPNEIIAHSKNKEDLYPYLSANKYNL